MKDICVKDSLIDRLFRDCLRMIKALIGGLVPDTYL